MRPTLLPVIAACVVTIAFLFLAAFVLVGQPSTTSDRSGVAESEELGDDHTGEPIQQSAADEYPARPTAIQKPSPGQDAAPGLGSRDAAVGEATETRFGFVTEVSPTDPPSIVLDLAQLLPVDESLPPDQTTLLLFNSEEDCVRLPVAADARVIRSSGAHAGESVLFPHWAADAAEETEELQRRPFWVYLLNGVVVHLEERDLQ